MSRALFLKLVLVPTLVLSPYCGFVLKVGLPVFHGLSSKRLYSPGFPQHNLHAPAFHMLGLSASTIACRFTSGFLNKEDSLLCVCREGAYLDFRKDSAQLRVQEEKEYL